MAITVSGVSIRHNGKIYHPDDVIEKITDSEAQRLVDLGVAFQIESLENQLSDEQKQAFSELDAAYGYDELKQVATAAGLSFKGNISKKDLMLLIINEDKTADFLEKVDE